LGGILLIPKLRPSRLEGAGPKAIIKHSLSGLFSHDLISQITSRYNFIF